MQNLMINQNSELRTLKNCSKYHPCAMTCIHFQFPRFTLLSHIAQSQQTTKTIIYHNAMLFQHRQNNMVSQLRIKALTSSLVLGVESSAAAYSGDLQVLLRTTTALLFVYWIANFVVPELIMKDLQSDNTDEEQETKQDDSTD